MHTALYGKARDLGADPDNYLLVGGVDGYVFHALVGLLGRAPMTPAQRAAGYRLLATLPNVHGQGTATDALKRSGMKITYADGAWSAYDVIIDRRSFQVLAITIHSKARKIDVSELITVAEWTNATPTAPSVPLRVGPGPGRHGSSVAAGTGASPAHVPWEKPACTPRSPAGYLARTILFLSRFLPDRAFDRIATRTLR